MTTSEGGRTDLADLLVLRTGLPAEDVDRRIGLAYAMAGIKHRIVAFYLADIDARGLQQTHGYRSTAQYAASRFGMSRREARDLLTVGKALLELPRIDRAFADGVISWTKVRELVKVATAEHEAKWLERAQKLTTDELALEVRLSRPGDPPRSWDDRKGLPEIRMKLEAQMPADVYAKWECVRRRVQDDTPLPLKAWEVLDAAFDALITQLDEMDSGEGRPRSAPRYCVVVRDGIHGNGPVTVETDDGAVPLDRVSSKVCACCADHIDPEQPDERSDRRVPEWLKRKVLARDKCRCRGCGCRLRLDLHHVVAWSAGGATEEGNLLVLCRKCHSLVHADLLFIEPDGRGDWRLLDREGRDVAGPDTRVVELAAELDQENVRLRLPALDTAPERLNGHAKAGTACHLAPPRGGPSIRPKRLEEIIGQDGIVADLAQAVRVAREHEEPLGHTLLMGGRGLGKTTIAGAVASELGTGLTAICGPHIRETSDLIPILRTLAARDILFIDEIHALPGPVAEVLYEAMEDFRLSLPGGTGGGTACHLPPFTLIGATTEPGRLPGPLLSRFENRHWIGPYGQAALALVIERAAERVGIEISAAAARRLAAAARGTPREALRLLSKARQQARAEGAGTIDDPLTARALKRLGIDEQGLDPLDRAYLEALAGHGPVGLSRLAALLGVDAGVLLRDHEPHLFRLGLATTTPAGRALQMA
jgi:Holliday junction DNA helicase RuvB